MIVGENSRDNDLNSSYWEKMKKNIEKYPVDLCKGKALKYNEL